MVVVVSGSRGSSGCYKYNGLEIVARFLVQGVNCVHVSAVSFAPLSQSPSKFTTATSQAHLKEAHLMTSWRFAHRLQYRALVLTVLCRVLIRTVAELPPFWKHGYGCDCRVGDFRSSHRRRTSSGVVGHADMNYVRACWTGQSVWTATRDQMQSQEITTLISQQISQFGHFARYVEGRWDRTNLAGLSRDDICSNGPSFRSKALATWWRWSGQPLAELRAHPAAQA